jgi:hypothetical protein
VLAYLILFMGFITFLCGAFGVLMLLSRGLCIPHSWRRIKLKSAGIGILGQNAGQISPRRVFMMGRLLGAGSPLRKHRSAC